MQKALLPLAEKYAKQNKRKSVWRKIVRAMACVVVFCTTYALILPAITLEQPVCGLEEHIHGNSCYDKQTTRQETKLVCSYDTLEVHEHTEKCRDENQELICGFADFVVHEHIGACYKENGILVCSLPEIKEHQHTEACYQVETHEHDDVCYIHLRGELICQREETEGHSHTAQCMTRGDLICTLEETEGHTHGDGCSETVLICELTVEPHVHGDGCYRQLICELPEDENHIHSEECSGLVLSCDLTEHPHVHGDDCYQTEFLCELPETEGHTHGDGCYAVVPACGIEETEGHVHSDSCYEQTEELICQPEEPEETVAPELICEEEEIRLHTHDEDECYETYLDENEEEQKRLICEETVVEEHIHNEHCFVTEEVPAEDVDVLTCGLEENEHHTHTDRCYGTWLLSCGQEEHIHNEECMPEPEVIYYCGQEEHIHSEICTDEAGDLICGLEEHSHSTACAALPGAIGYAYRDTMRMMFSAPRTEDSKTYHTDIAPLLYGIRIVDSQNNLVYDSDKPEDGSKTVLLGEKCRIILYFKENTSNQFETAGEGILTYQIPSNLSSDIVDTGVILNRDNQLVARYQINNNELIITPVPVNGENFFGTYNDVKLEIEFDAEVIHSLDQEYTEITFDNSHKINLKVQEDGSLIPKKKQLQYNQVTQTITYECTVTAYGGTMSLAYIDDWWWPDDVYILRDSIQLKDTAGNDITDGWTYKLTESERYFSLTPQTPVTLSHGESITLIYSVRLKEGINRNVEFTNTFAVRDTLAPEETYATATTTSFFEVTNVTKTGIYVPEGENDTVQDALEWTVEIDNSDLNEITITDQLGTGQTFCQHKPIYIRAIRTDGTNEIFNIGWDSVTLNTEKNRFTYTLPTEALADGKYEFAEYKLVYYSHYTLTEGGPDVQYFNNTVHTNIKIGNNPTWGSAEVGVLAVPPGIQKGVTADDDWLTFTVECFMPAGLNNRTSVLLYDTLASWGTEIHGYIQQVPDSLTVTISPEGGTPYELQPYVDQESAEGTYLLAPDGQSFTMYFNTSQAAADASTWKCNVDSTLTVSYRISLDAVMLDGWGGSPNGETLRQFLERTGQNVQNAVQLNYAPKDNVKTAVIWTPPKEPEPHLRKTAAATQADGVYDYSVWFDTGDSYSTIFKTSSYQDKEGTWKEKNHVLSLALTDSFDSRMEYVPGSLKVYAWSYEDPKELLQIYQLAEGTVPTITTSGDTTTMVISAADLIGQEGKYTWLTDQTLLAGLEYMWPGYRYEFVYQLRVKDAVKKSTTEGILELENTASITWTDEDGQKAVDPAHNRISYDTGILQKNMHHIENTNLVQFSILVNHNALDLNPDGDTYIISDTMSSNLGLLYSSLNVQMLDEETGELLGVLTPTDCHFTYNPDENKMTLSVPDGKILRINYNCVVHGTGGETVHITNTVELDGQSWVKDIEESQFYIWNSQGRADASSEAFYLQKQDGNNHHVLAGVTFHLYGDVQSDTPNDYILVDGQRFYHYKSHTTNENGIAYIDDTQLTAEHLYVLVEESPPTGYVALEEPFMFYMEERPPGGDPEIPCVVNGEFVVIENFPIGYELPATGGAGTTSYTMGGLLLMMAAAILLYSHSSKRRKEDRPSF